MFAFDRDRLTKNDAIGTAFLNLSKMSYSGGDMEGTHVLWHLFLSLCVLNCYLPCEF